MKLLSITVPCYQSQDYMRKCINSLLGGSDAIEILIVDDGSTDATGRIADEYQATYPGMVHAIHQENGGHGAAVMTGLRHATGRYFKVVDSDDRLDENALDEVVRTIAALDKKQESVDLLICNYTYDKSSAKHKTAIRYGNVFPKRKVCTWDEMHRFLPHQYLHMHSAIYRTELLRECNLELPLHTFYVDALFVYIPLPHVKTFLYLDVDLYRYFIGREDQSVNEQVLLGRVDQYIYVNKLILKGHDMKNLKPAKLQKYMCRCLAMVTATSIMLLYKIGTPQCLQKKRELLDLVQQTDPWFYRYFTRRSILGFILKREGVLWRKFSLWVYGVARAIVGFN